MKLFGRSFDARATLAEFGQACRDLAQSRTLLIGIILIVGYWAVVPHIPTAPQNDALRVGRTSVAIAVAVGFGMSLLTILRTPWPGLTGLIALGILLSWCGTAGSSIWVLLWSLAGRPKWMLDSNINGFFIYLNMIGGFLHLIAYNAIDGRIPKKAWMKIGIGIGVVFGVSAWLVLTTPDATAIAHWLKPMFADFPDQPD